MTIQHTVEMIKCTAYNKIVKLLETRPTNGYCWQEESYDEYLLSQVNDIIWLTEQNIKETKNKKRIDKEVEKLNKTRNKEVQND